MAKKPTRPDRRRARRRR